MSNERKKLRELEELEFEAYSPHNDVGKRFEDKELLALAKKVTDWRKFSTRDEPGVCYGTGIYSGNVNETIRVDLIEIGLFWKSYNLRVVFNSLEVGRVYIDEDGRIRELYHHAEEFYRETLLQRIKNREKQKDESVESVRRALSE
ncbi:MAG: hypothetical protein V1889_00025 [archaeon]